MHQTSLFRGRLIIAVLIAGLIAAPLIALAVAALTPTTAIWQHIGNYVLLDYLKDSVLLCLGVATLTLILGVAPAWLCGAYEFPGRKYIEWLLVVPLALPPYVVAYIYTGMLDYGGTLHEWLHTHFDVLIPIRSMGGGIAVLAFTLYPYTYLFVRATLRQQPALMMEAGRTLGATPAQTFIHVILPSLRPALIVATAIVLMETLGDFGTVEYFGINALSAGIIRTWFALGSLEGAVQLALILLGFMLILVFLKNGAQKNKYQQKHLRGPNRIGRLTGIKALCALIVCVVPPLLGFALPVAQIIAWLPDASYSSQYLSPLLNSLSLAAATAVVLLLLVLILAYAKRHYHTPLMRFVINVATSGYAIPGVVIAAGILVLAAELNALGVSDKLTLMLSGGFAGLFLAYIARYATLSFNSIDTTMTRISISLDDAARMLKTSSLGLIARIHVPLIKSGLFVAFLLGFVEVIKELPATLLLRPFNFNTLAVHIYELASDERLIDIAPHTLALTLISLAPLFIVVRSIKNL